MAATGTEDQVQPPAGVEEKRIPEARKRLPRGIVENAATDEEDGRSDSRIAPEADAKASCVRSEFQQPGRRSPVMLILGSALQPLPWESFSALNDTDIYRSPSLASAAALQLVQTLRKSPGSVPS